MKTLLQRLPAIEVGGRNLIGYVVFGVLVILAAAVVAPAVAASAFAAERERGTLDLLLLQGPGPARIVLVKVLAALIFGAILLGAGVLLFVSAHRDRLSPLARMMVAGMDTGVAA